jgi:hypothetical protein
MTQGSREPEFLPSPEERRQNKARARGSPSGNGGSRGRGWWGRRSTRAKIAIIIVAAFVSLAALGAALSGGNDKQAVVTVTEGAQSRSTLKQVVKTPAQRKAEARARVRAAKIARAKARAAARRARAAAAAHAAAVEAANRWHRGYIQQDGNVFWQWRNGLHCQEFAQSGCWHVAVITRNGCPSYVAVNANEYQGGAIIGQLLDNQGYGIPPKTVRIFELDADTAGVTAADVSIDCT